MRCPESARARRVPLGVAGLARGLGALAALVAVAAPGSARALEREIVLREQLGADWKRELVGFPFEAEKGSCRRDTLSLSGPRGPVAVQLTEASLWGGGGDFVRSGRLVFVTDLAPLETLHYTLRCQSDGPAAPVPAGDLTIERAPDSVTLTTALFGARLLLGSQRYSRSVPAAEAPGPIAKLRLDDGRTWFGGSRMFGTDPIAGYSAELVEAGPVLAEVALRYDYAGGASLDLRAQLAAGDSALLLDTETTAALPQSGFDVLLSPGLPPLTFRVAIEAGSKRHDASGSTPAPGTWIDVPLSQGGAGLITRLTPWADWWDDTTQTAIRLKIAGRHRELHITRREAGDWVQPGPSTSGRRLAEKRLDLLRAEDGEISLHVDDAEGRRHFAIGLLPPDDPVGADYLDRFRVVRSGELGRHLDVVKDYALDWTGTTPHPHLYLDAQGLERARARSRIPPRSRASPGSSPRRRSGRASIPRPSGSAPT